MRSTLLTMAALMLGLQAAIANADTIYVPDDYPTIQGGINAAFDGDAVVVRDGVYTGPGNRDLDFGGKPITVRSETGPENCIIDCEGSSDDEHRGFYFHSGEGSDSVVDGFTITNGYVYGTGGGICCNYSSPTITNCMISENRTHIGSGSGVYCGDNSSPTITNCTISGNSTYSNGGGGVYCYRSSPTITNCTISGNWASGVRCWDSSPTITNCTISGNSAGYGGGIRCNHSSPTITNCTISSNLANFGCGIYCYESSPAISNCTFSGNGAYCGGGIYCISGDLTITNCTFSGNVASDGGGGVFCYYSGPTISNCTFSGNSANRGGGIYSCSVLDVVNCVLWGDTAPDGPELYVGDGTLTVSYSDVYGGQAEVYVNGGTFEWGEGNIVADPLFVGSDDYHLSADSPCIDTGDPDFIPGPDERDIDGQMRVWDGDDDGEWIVDMGSDEFGSMIPGDLDKDGCVGHADLGILLSDWGCSGGDCPGDCDFDGDVDHADLGLLLGHWGEGCP